MPRSTELHTHEKQSADQNNKLLMSEVISAFSYALDLTEGQPAGHCIRCCWIGMHIGHKLGLNENDMWDLYYTLLLKDAGCSSNAARLCELYGGDDRSIKHDFKVVDSQKFTDIARFVFEHVGVGDSMGSRLKKLLFLTSHGEELADELVTTRCERGAEIAQKLGLNENISNGVRYLDEHWNGHGKPYKLVGHDIPINARIALLSQVVDVFFTVGGQQAALAEVRKRGGSWFDPEIVRAVESLASDGPFWQKLTDSDVDKAILSLEPEGKIFYIDEEQLDNITEAFGMVVDSKSPFTFNHSSRVALYANAVAEELGIDKQRCRWLRRGAMLHDIGKLGVSNAILDKPGKLDEAEWIEVRNHARFTEEILMHLAPFAELAVVASAHHERLDGKGYPYGKAAEDLMLETRIITVADIFDAITAERPYRGAIPIEKSLKIMEGEVGTAIDGDCLDALKTVLPSLAV